MKCEPEASEFRIEFLADHPECAPQVACWCLDTWPLYYHGNREHALAEQRRHAQKEIIPSALVAIGSQGLLGTIALFEEDMKERPQYSPWLGNFYVSSEFRGRGIGRALFKGAVDLAADFKIARLYAGTSSLGLFFAKYGWTYLESVDCHEMGGSTEVWAIDIQAHL